MPIKSSPAPLAISEIATEFSDSTPNQMSEFYRGGSLVNDVATNNTVPASGAIDIGDFYGCGNAVLAACPAGNNTDVAPLFPGTYTSPVSKVLTIAAPISLTGSNAAALTVPSNLAGTLDIQNAGTIVGSSGTTGLGANAGAAAGPGNAAGAGGTALSIQANGVTINNSGTISGGGGGGGGGSGGVNTDTSNTVNFGTGSNAWTQVVSGITIVNNSVVVAGITWTGGGANTTQLNSSNIKNPSQVNRGNPTTNVTDINSPKRFNVAGGFYTETTSTPGQVGGAGGRGFGFDGSSVISAQNGVASPGNGGAGGNGGAAGTAGSAGGATPLGAGGSAGAAGNSVTSPGSVNYTVSNSGTINGTQG